MRYFFDVVLGGETMHDNRGAELPSLADMQCSAIDLAAELERELYLPQSSAGYLIEVMDTSGRRVFALPIYREQFGIEPIAEPERHCA